MDPVQLELDFSPDVVSVNSPMKACWEAELRQAVVVGFAAFAEAKARQAKLVQRAHLFHAILKSVDHIKGSDPEAEAM